MAKLVSEKVMRFQGKNTDLNQLSQQIVQQLNSEGYKTQSTTAPMGIVIQAQKAGILRDIITADRAFTIMIAGQPNDFSIHIGIGKWIQNIAVAAAEVILLSALFLAVDVPEMLWTLHVENALAKEIAQIVEAAPQAQKIPTPGMPQATPQPPATPGLCGTCGYQNDANASFCIKCGTRLK